MSTERSKPKKSFARKYLKADYTSDDQVIDASDISAEYSNPTEYLGQGKAGRFAEMVWRVILILLGLIIVLAIPLAFIADKNIWTQPWWILLTAVIIWAMSVWLVMASQSYLRWMWRNRDKPRRRAK